MTRVWISMKAGAKWEQLLAVTTTDNHGVVDGIVQVPDVAPIALKAAVQGLGKADDGRPLLTLAVGSVEPGPCT